MNKWFRISIPQTHIWERIDPSFITLEFIRKLLLPPKDRLTQQLIMESFVNILNWILTFVLLKKAPQSSIWNVIEVLNFNFLNLKGLQAKTLWEFYLLNMFPTIKIASLNTMETLCSVLITGFSLRHINKSWIALKFLYLQILN